MENNQPTPPLTSTPITPFLHQVLSSFQDPLYNPETDNYKPMATILWNLDIFRRNFQNLTDLTDFIELAKKNFTYEVHPYGSVLMKEHEFADKFCLVLQGSLQKLQQRPYQEVEQDIRNSPRRKTFRMNESQDDSFTQSSSFYPRSNVLIRKPNPTLLNATNHRLSIDYSQAADSPKLRFKREHSKASLKNEDPIRALPPSAIGESSPSSPRRVSIRMSPFSGFAEAMESPEIPRLGTIGKQLSKNLMKPNKQFFNIRESLQRTGTATSSTAGLFQQSPSLKANGRNSSVGHNESPENGKSWIKDEDEMVLENNENVEFIKHIVRKSPEIKQRCFMMDAVRVRCTRTYQPGDYFGENFFKQHQFKENYIIAVASEEVHLAVMSREDYKSIINELASRPNNKLQFFKKVFPSFDEDSVNRFSQYFYKKRYEKNETIYTQGEAATNLFLLQDGDVRLFKETQFPAKNVSASPMHSQTIELPIASITKGQFFGEEMLLNEPERLFTATSSVSNTIVYYLDPKGYKKLRGKYEDFLEILRDQAKNRFLWRKNRVAELSSQYKMTSDLSRKSLVMDEQLPSINATIQKTTTQGLEKLSKRISRRTSTGLNLSLTQYLGENTVWATSKSTSTRGKTSMRDQIENPEKDLAEMVKSSAGLYKSRFSRKTLSVAALGEEEIPAIKKKSDEPKNMLGRLGDSLKRSLVDLQAKKNSILQAGSPHHIAKQLTGNLGNMSPKVDLTKVSQHNESPSPSPTHSPKFIKRMSMSMEMNNEQAKGFPMMPLAVIKKEQNEGNISPVKMFKKEQNEGNFSTVKIIKRKSQKNMTTMSFFKGPGSPKTPKTPKIPLTLGYPEAGMYELQLGRGFHSRSQGTLVNYMEDSPMNKDEGGNQWKGNGENKKLKKILHLVNYHTGGHASREGTRREEGEKEFVNMHMQAMKKKAYNLIRVSDR